MSNHTEITDPPDENKDFWTRIYFIRFEGGKSANFDIASRPDPYEEELSDPAILKIIHSADKDFGRRDPSHFDFKFERPTKIAFRLDIKHWEFAQLNRYDYDTYPFYLKNPVSHERFRGLNPIELPLPAKPDNKTIVLYNLGKKGPQGSPPELHKYGLRINVVDRTATQPIFLTPLEIDPEFKNEG